jgi:hypothetical protein
MAGKMYHKVKELVKRTPVVKHLLPPAKWARDTAKTVWRRNPVRRAKHALISRLDSLLLANVYLVEQTQRGAQLGAERHQHLAKAVESLEARLAELEAVCARQRELLTEIAGERRLHLHAA